MPRTVRLRCWPGCSERSVGYLVANALDGALAAAASGDDAIHMIKVRVKAHRGFGVTTSATGNIISP